jgi:hypothetical protein
MFASLRVGRIPLVGQLQQSISFRLSCDASERRTLAMPMGERTSAMVLSCGQLPEVAMGSAQRLAGCLSQSVIVDA